MNLPVPSPASARNQAPILGVLRYELREARMVIEIGAGNGHHAAAFAAALPHLLWQPTEIDDALESLRLSLDDTGVTNLLPARALDLRQPHLPEASCDALYACNVVHIVDEASGDALIRLGGTALRRRGRLLLYGPFRREGRFNTSSNEAFDASLRAANPASGIRDLERLADLARQAGLDLRRIYAMPANNLLVVWQRSDDAS